MSKTFSWLLLLIVFGIFAGVVHRALRDRSAAGKGLPDYSVLSLESNGLGAGAHVLRKLGWEPVTLTRPIQHSEQRQGPGCLLIVAEPTESSWLPGQTSQMSDVDVQGILHWVERGNTLLLCSKHTTPLHEKLNLFIENDARVAPDATTQVALVDGGGHTDGVEHLLVEGRDLLRGNVDLPLWLLDDQPGGAVLRRGKGRVIVIADPSILTLRGLWRGDNLRFLVNVTALHTGDGRVYFDEYHHGLRSGGGFWGYLHLHGQQWLVLLIGLVAGMAVWAVAVRLGQAAPTLQEKQADAVDYASALARIYQRAGVHRIVATTLCRDFLAALTRHLRLRRTALPAEILAAWRKQHHAKGEDIETLLRGLTDLRSDAVSQRQLLTWARDFERFTTEVLRAG